MRDGGIRGVAISLKQLDERAQSSRATTTAPSCGVERRRRDRQGCCSFATREELGGVEFLGGVPGTVGGGLIMNAGTYLGEFKDVTTRVHSVDERGALVVRDNAELRLRLSRTRPFPPPRWSPGRACACRRGRAREIEQAVRDAARSPQGARAARRAQRRLDLQEPARRLRRPPDRSRAASRGVASAAPRSRRCTPTGWSTPSGATAKDFLALVEIVRAAVVERFGVRLELEVKVVGEDA